MQIRSLVLGGVAAAGLFVAGAAGGLMGPQSVDVRVTAPSPAPVRGTVATQTAAREEQERVREVTAVPVRPMRFGWDGKNRRPGDRAHKRLKRSRASGRR